MKNSTKNHLLALIAILFCGALLSSTQLYAQFISYPTPAQALTRGLDSSLLTVQISFPACTNVSVTVNLGATNTPGVIQYIPGSVTKLSGVGTITEGNISNLSSPVFTVGSTAQGQTLTFTIRRRAFCGSASSTKDNIVVTGTGANCNFSEVSANVNSYSLLAPAFTITPPAALSNVLVGTAYNRTISVVNGGNGCADTVGFWIKYPAASMQLNSLSFGGNPLTPLFVSGDSIYYELTGSLLGGDNKLCNGESVSLVENVTVLKCNVITRYGAIGYDFNNTRCQTTSTTAGMTMSSAIPNLNVTLSPASALTACFSDAPRLMTYTITNAGAGPATNVVVNAGANAGNLPRSDHYGYIDTASLLITPGSGPAFHPTNFTGILLTTNTAGLNNLACNVGRVAHFQVTLPANFIIDPGETVTLTYNIIYCPTNNNCTDVLFGTGQGVNIAYRNSCGNTSYSTSGYIGTRAFAYNSPSVSAFEFPAQVRSGECFEVALASNTNPTNSIGANGFVEYEINIPAGVTFNSALMVGNITPPHAGYPVVVGNKVVTRYNVNSGGNPVKFSFCTPPGGTLCGNFNIDAVITTSPDSTCVSQNRVKRCVTAPINFVCVVPCPGGGTVPAYWAYGRRNFGAPDNNFNKMPDNSGSINPAVVFKDRFRPGDTLRSEYRSILVAQTAPVAINAWPHINASWAFSKHIWAPANAATVTVKRGGNTTVVPGVPIATVAYGNSFNTDFSQAPAALTALAPFLPNDSIIIEADFILRDSLLSGVAGTPQTTAVDDGTRGKLFADVPDVVLLTNSVHASTVANPAPAQRFTCFVPLYNANILHLYNFTQTNGSTLVGCTPARQEVRTLVRKLGEYTGNYFPGEYRPEFIPDSMLIRFAPGLSVVPGTQNVNGFFVNTPPTFTAVNNADVAPFVTISGSAATGTTVVFNARAALAANPTWRLQSEGTFYAFSIAASGSCATPNNFAVTGRNFARVAGWPNSVAEATFEDSAITNIPSVYSAANKPTVLISSPGTTSTPSSDTAIWTVLLQNSSGQTAPFNFIRVGSNVSYNNIVVRNGLTTLTPNSNGLYELGGINATGSVTLTISANTNSCALDSILVESGWDCTTYPSGQALSLYNCWRPIWLKSDPLPSQIQLSIDQQPKFPDLALCEEDTVIFKMNSALANYADNPTFSVIAPNGLGVIKAEIEYPEGSRNWEEVTATIVNDVLVYAVEDHSLVGSTGLPGTVSNPGNAGRAARLRLTYTTTCDYSSGSRILVQQKADRPCGSPIPTSLGFNNLVRTNGVNITGATAFGNANFNLNFANINIGCNSTTLSGFLIVAGSPTTPQDSIIVTLQPGLAYAGNLVSAEGITLAAGFPVAGPGQSQIVRLKVPAGITPGTQINYSFDVEASAVNNGCGTLDALTEFERSVGQLSCGANLCPNQAKTILGGTVNQLTVTKPDITVIDADYVSGNLATGGSAIVSVTLANNGNDPVAANAYEVEFFCGTSLTPFATGLFPQALPAQGIATANMNIAVPNSPACENGQLVTVLLRPATDNGSSQCLCTESARPLAQVLPVVLESFNALVNNCQVDLKWRSLSELNFNRYEIEYSTNGSLFVKAGTALANRSNSNYAFAHAPARGRAYYRLVMVDNNGSKKYSNIIALNINCNGKSVLIYPNPATDVININMAGYNRGTEMLLLNGMGQTVARQRLLNGSNQLAVNKLAAGSYFVVVIEEDGTRQTYKVQVKR
jgi:hypothetical protein